MNPNEGQSTGSFGSAAGGMSPELQAAISRRAGDQGGSPLNQVTQGAPTANPQTQAPAPMAGVPPSGAAQPGLSGSPMPPDQNAQNGVPFGSAEAKMILGSLSNYLKSITKFHGV